MRIGLVDYQFIIVIATLFAASVNAAGEWLVILIAERNEEQKSSLKLTSCKKNGQLVAVKYLFVQFLI